MFKVLPMSDALFRQRRRVINMLYSARAVIGRELPRIKVRIVEFNKGSTLGLCMIDQDYITVSSECVTWDDTLLRHVVWHELCHAYFNAQHNEKCPLMRPTVTTGEPEEVLVKVLERFSKATNDYYNR